MTFALNYDLFDDLNMYVSADTPTVGYAKSIFEPGGVYFFRNHQYGVREHFIRSFNCIYYGGITANDMQRCLQNNDSAMLHFFSDTWLGKFCDYVFNVAPSLPGLSSLVGQDVRTISPRLS